MAERALDIIPEVSRLFDVVLKEKQVEEPFL